MGSQPHRRLAVVSAPANQSRAVALGWSHTCTLLRGSVRCWGGNDEGQLGLGNYDSFISTPQSSRDVVTGAVSLSAGGFHTCVALEVGDAKCWGSNGSGQLGVGSSTSNVLAPALVRGIGSTVLIVAAGAAHTCALLSDGTVKCWGDNRVGQLGTGLCCERVTLPQNVSSLPSASVGLALGAWFSCALLADGSVFCWGSNLFGQLGTGSCCADSWLPVQVQGLAYAATSVHAGGSHVCALLTDRTVVCWGNNEDQELGPDVMGEESSIPVNATFISQPVSIVSTGAWHSCVVAANGSMYCWGSNEDDQLGDPSTLFGVAHLTRLPSTIASVSAGLVHTCALTADDSLYCWGSNDFGQLGSGCCSDSLSPKLVFCGGGLVVVDDHCARCPSDQLFDQANNECVSCPAGSFLNRTVDPPLEECSLCPAGRFSGSAGATSSTVCRQCPVGLFSPIEGATSDFECRACDAGSIPNENATQCNTCPAGTFAQRIPSSCQPCEAGRFSASGSMECEVCTSGRFAGEPYSTSCTECPEGEVSEPESFSCHPCDSSEVPSENRSSCISCDDSSALIALGCQSDELWPFLAFVAGVGSIGFLCIMTSMIRTQGIMKLFSSSYRSLIAALSVTLFDQLSDVWYFRSTRFEDRTLYWIIFSSIVFLTTVRTLRGIIQFAKCCWSSQFFDRDGQPRLSYRQRYFAFSEHPTLVHVVNEVNLQIVTVLAISVALIVQGMLWSFGFFAWIPLARGWATRVGFAPFRDVPTSTSTVFPDLDERSLNFIQVGEVLFESVPQAVCQTIHTLGYSGPSTTFVVSVTSSAFKIISALYIYGYQLIVKRRCIGEMKFLDEETSTFCLFRKMYRKDIQSTVPPPSPPLASGASVATIVAVPPPPTPAQGDSVPPAGLS